MISLRSFEKQLKSKNNMAKEWADNFITVGELRKMIEHLEDYEFIAITIRGETYKTEHKIQHVEDSTSIGFWELRCE